MKGKLSRVIAGSGLTKTDLGYVPLATGDQKAWKLFYPGQTYTVYESYDTENRLASLQYPSAQAVVYDRDGDGRITRIRLKTGTNTYTTIVDLVSYKPNGPIASLKYGDGYTETLTYDASYRLTGMLDANASVTLRNLTLAYDAKDNLTGVTDNLAAPNSEALTYSPRDMLATAVGAYGTLGWTYDGVGNRVSEVRNPGTGSVTDTYTYPATSNRLSTIATSGGGGTRALGYDAAGNVITDNRAGQAYGYTYDNANRMASVTLNGVTQATYLYNYLGQQVIRTLTPSGTVIQSIYAPDGNRIAEYTSAGALIRQYIWMDLKPVAIVEGGVVYYVRADHIGRPVFATTAAGTVVWRAAYKPFGGVTTTTGTPPDARFPGQWYQAETGLYQNWMRNYDPATGRYIQADPLGLVDGASVYGYVRGNPERWVDPRGAQSIGAPSVGPIGGAFGPLGTLAPGTPAGDAYGQAFRNTFQNLLDLSHQYNPIDLGIQTMTGQSSLPWVKGVPDTYRDVPCPPNECDKSTAPFWQSLRPAGGIYKTWGSGSGQLYFKWDYKHFCEVEVFDRRGYHLGAVDGRSGAPIKGPEPGRRENALSK